MGLTKNTILNLAHIISIRPELHKGLDKIYLSDILKYKKYEKDTLCKHPFLVSSTLAHQEYSKRAICVILSSEEEDNYDELLKYLKNKFPFVSNYLRTRDKVDIREFVTIFYEDNRNIGMDERPSDNISALFAIAEITGKEIIDKSNIYIDARNSLIEEVSDFINKKCGYIHASSTTKQKVNKMMAMFRAEYLDGVTNFADIWNLAENCKVNEYTTLFIKEKLYPYKILGDTKITESDLEDILTSYIYAGKDPADKKAIVEYIVGQSYLLSLIREYNFAKQLYQNTEFTTIVQTVAPPKPQRVENIKTYESEYKYGKKKLAEANKEITQLKRQISKLKDQLEESEANKKELHSLREFVHNLSQEDEDEYEETSIDYRTVQHIKSVIIGGRPNWQQRMKEKLPNFSFIDTDALNFDTGILDSVKTVFVNTNYISHGMYYKVASAAEKKGVKMVFLNKQNEDIVINKIYKECMMQ